jgi:hypothetical protein
MVLNNPEALISFAESIGVKIGTLKDSPQTLLARLLVFADGVF